MSLTPLQFWIVMLFGAVIALAGLWLLFTRNDPGANRLKILGQEFEISTPALVVFLVGSAIFVLPIFLPREPPRIVEPPIQKGELTPDPSAVEKEPNDTFFSATPMAIGTHVKGSVTFKDDRDIYAFQTSPDLQRPVRIRVMNKSTTLRPSLWIYDAQKARLKYAYKRAAIQRSRLYQSELTPPFTPKLNLRWRLLASTNYLLPLSKTKDMPGNRKNISTLPFCPNDCTRRISGSEQA